MPDSSKLHIPPTNYYLLVAQQEPGKNAYLFMENSVEFSGRKSGERTISRPKNNNKIKKERKKKHTHTKKARGLQKYERGDSRWNQMPALRFQTVEKHQRSLAQPPFGVQLPMKHLILFYQLNHRLRRQLLAWKCDNNTSMAVCLDNGQRTF